MKSRSLKFKYGIKYFVEHKALIRFIQKWLILYKLALVQLALTLLIFIVLVLEGVFAELPLLYPSIVIIILIFLVGLIGLLLALSSLLKSKKVSWKEMLSMMSLLLVTYYAYKFLEPTIFGL